MNEKEKTASNSRPFGPPPVLLLLFSLLSLFLLSSGCLARQSTSARDIWPLFSTYWGPWQLAFFTAIALGVGIIALAYAYAAAVRDDKLKNWCWRELFQQAYSIFILLAVLAIIASLSWTVMALSSVSVASGGDARAWQAYVAARCAPTTNSYYDRPCHIRLAEDYLQILASASEAQARTVLNYNSILAEASSVGLSFRGMPDPAGYFDIAPFAGFSMPVETLGFVFDISNKSLMTLRFQQFMLEFLHLAFFPLFMALGLFLRSLYFTRRLGGLLIALALGAYVVYPMMYVFFEGMLFSFTGPWPAPSQAQFDAYVEQVGSSLYPIYVDTEGASVSPQQPDPAAPGYNDALGPRAGAFTGTRGAYSFDGYIEPWEECNEFSFSNRTSAPGDSGAPNTLPFGCPPRNAAGQLIPGREGDYYCNHNSATCTSDPAHGYGRVPGSPTRDQYGNYISPFRAQFMDPATRNTLVKSSAGLSALMCTNTSTAASDAEARRVLLGQTQVWQERILQGWGGAFKIALVRDELLGFNGVIDNLAKILVFSLLCPFLSIMVMLASIKVLSPLLGGDVEIAGLTRLI
ncbi:Uncharacterised protein [uncultured archaeon]|nr:Uncharacterised protein [uncultured archaeon]